MNLKTTLVLLVLAAGAGVFGFLGKPEWFGLTPRTPDPAGQGTLQILEEQLTRNAIKGIKIQPRGGEGVVELERGPGGVWAAPGQWPTRKLEVDQLIALLSGLRSRFVPIPLSEEETLEKYGLHNPAVIVTVKAGPTDYTLAMNEYAAAEDESQAAVSRLDLPTYLHLDDKPEIVRLAPGLVAELSRPADYYLQRRLFTDFERVAKESTGGFGGMSDSAEKVEQLAAKGLAVEDKKPDGSKYALVKNGEEWELSQPTRDRVDPEKRKSVLQALPDIWAEQFVMKPDKDLAKYGLKEPQEIIRVTTNNGRPITLLIGNESPTKKTRTVARPAPQMPGMPPQQMTQKIEERFRYAKLENNDQIFEIKADKLKDVFVPVADLRDSRVARFESKDVTRLELTHGPETIVLAKVKDKDKDTERWHMEKPTAGDAETSKITDILDKLAFLSARDKDVLDKSDAKTDGLDKPQATLAVTVEEEVKGDGDTKTKKPPRTLKLTVGRHDTEKKKLYLKDDWGRINVVEDSLQALLTRPATAYRGRRVLDFAAKDVDEIDIERQGQKLVSLQQKDGAWKLTAPVAADADAGKASQLARDLGGLEVVEHVSDNPKPEKLAPLPVVAANTLGLLNAPLGPGPILAAWSLVRAGGDQDQQYGLARPALTVRMKLAGGKSETLLVGKQREGKQEFYAKRAADPGVFVVKKEIHDALEHDSLTYRPLQLWQVPGDDITAVRIAKEGQDEYRLTRKEKENAWQIAGPFEAAALPATVQTMTQELAGPRGERCVAHSAKDKELEKYGLDKPHLRLTVTTKDGDKTKDRTLLIGKSADQPPHPTLSPAPGGEGRGAAGARYAKLGDGEAVYVVPDKLLAAVDHGALDLLDKKLLALDSKDVTSIKSNDGGTALKLEKQDKGWKVVESPAGQPFAADELIASRVVNLWSNLNAERFAAYGPKADLAKFGLDKPAWTVTVATTAKDKPAEHTLAVGKLVENGPGDRFARLDNGPGIVVLPSILVKDLERTHLDFVDRTLLKFDPASASGLARKHGADVLEVVKKDEGWRMLKPADLPADDKTIQSLFDQLANLRAESIAAYPAKDLKQYGLDQPAALVTLRLGAADGKPNEKILKIGKETGDPKQGRRLDRFVQVEGSTVVAVLPGSLTDRLLAGPIAFRDRNVARFADADKAILERGLRKATFTKVDGTWKLTAPIDADAEHNDLDDFVNVLARLRADEMESDKPKPTADDLKQYGLDKPAATWRFFSGDKEVLGLLIGSHPALKGGGKDKRCFAKLANSDLVFRLDPPTTAKVEAEYRSKTLWPTSLDAAQVESLRYSGNSTPFALEKLGEGWQVAGKPSVKVNMAAVNETLAALSGLKPERYVVDKGADFKLYGLEPPQLVIEAEAPTGRRALHIGSAEGDSKRHYARVTTKDRTDVFLISEADAAKLVRQLAAFTQTVLKPTP
jgi:hypothetical protein